MKNFKTTLAINKAIVSYELQRLRDYAGVMERMVAAEVDRESYDLAEAAKSFSEEDRAEFYTNNADYLQALNDDFIYQHRLSLISTIYSVFESHLTHICRMLCVQKKVRFGLRDLSGNSNIDKAKKLLGKLFEIPLNEAEWEKMERFSSLRNIASHLNGQLTEEASGLLPKIQTVFPAILDAEGIQLKPTGDGALVLIFAVESFYKSLYDTLQSWGGIKAVAP